MDNTYNSHNSYNPAKIQNPHIASIIVYLNLSFILGLIYFILTVVGLSLGLGLIIIWIGIPIFIGTFAMIRGIGAIERSIARTMLNVPIREPRPDRRPKSLWKRCLDYIRDPLTWKSLLYILLKFPIGIINFSISTTLLATCGALLLAPLGYAIATFVLQIIGIHVQNNTPAWLTLINVNVTGDWDTLMFIKSFLYTGLGLLVWWLSCFAFRGLGWLSAELARVFLSPIEEDTVTPGAPYIYNQHHYQQNDRPYTQGYESQPATTNPDQPQASYQEHLEHPEYPREMPLQYRG